MSMRKTRTFLVTIDWKSDNWEAEAIARAMVAPILESLSSAEIVKISAEPKPVSKTEVKKQ